MAEAADPIAGDPVVIRTDLGQEAIDGWVRAHPAATGYHLAGWTTIVQRAFGHETMYLAAERRQRVVGVLPLVFFRSRVFGRCVVSMPFLNYGGVAAEDPAAERALLDRAIEETRRAGGSHLELRHTAQRFDTLSAKRHKVAMRLALPPSRDELWTRLDRKVRNQIRKGEKSELTVEHGGVELLDAFYGVFAHNMRDLGTPVYGRAFFREVLETFSTTTALFVVRHHGAPVAASLVYWHGPMIEVPWASALRAANPLSANVFLYWHMLAFAVERGFGTFDFGRSTPNEGTFHFKRQWGAEPLELVWEYWTANGVQVPNVSPANPKFRAAIRMWQHLPVPLATALGPHIVRNIP